MKNERLNRSFFSLVSFQIKEYPLLYLMGFICLVMTHLIQSELPFKASLLVKNQSLTREEMGIFLLMAIGIIFFRTTSRILFFYPARLLQKELRRELLQSLTEASPLRYKNYSKGELFQYLTGDIEQIRALIGFVGLQLGNVVIAFVILIPRLAHFNSKLLWTLIPMFVTFLFFSFAVSRNKGAFVGMQKASGDLQNNIIEAYLGKKTIKNFHAEEEFVNLFKDASKHELSFFKRTSKSIAYTLPMMSLGFAGALISGALVIHDQNLKAYDFVLFSGFVFLLMEPLNYLSWIGMVISRSSASWKRLTELEKQLKIKVNLEEAQSGKWLTVPFWDKKLLFDFKKGTWTAIFGATGAGKTFLLERIAENLKHFQQKVSMVAQDPYIFNDSIENNIFLGLEKTPEKVVVAKKYLKVFGLDYVESNLDELLKIEVGENGKRLSGGQAKRLQLVRSLVSEADYIIWDDPFSSIDLILEKEILTKIKEDVYLKDKIFVFSSHRLSTVKYGDYFYYVEKECGIVETGEMEKMLLMGSKSYEYFKFQMV